MSRRDKRLRVLPCEGCGAQCCHVAPFTEDELTVAKIAYGGLPKGAIVLPGGRTKAEFGSKPVVLVVMPESELRCAFVDEQNRCSIYDARPLPCKQYGRIKQLPCMRLEPEKARRIGGAAAEALGILRGDDDTCV